VTALPITIRLARSSDRDTLIDFNSAMAFETEQKSLDPGVLGRGVMGVFEDIRRGFYLIADHGSRPVGCLMITSEWSDWRCGDWWWIQSVYIKPEARRKGVFRGLYKDVERRARATAGVVGIRLYVEHNNAVAQHTYTQLGMQDAGYRMMEVAFAKTSPT
jgi:GNAT superfamily N-acetyltransferase